MAQGERVERGGKLDGPAVQRALDRILRLFPLTRQYIANDAIGPDQSTLSAQQAAGSAALTLTQAAQDVVGATLTVPVAGVYTFGASFDFDVQVAGTGFLVGEVNAAGVGLPGVAVSSPPTTGRGTHPTVGLTPSLAAGATVKLRAYKELAGGTGVAYQDHTKLLVIGPF